MIKQMGFILMLVSSMAISAKDCYYDHITYESDVHEWSIPKDCTSLDLSDTGIDDRKAGKLAAALNKNDSLNLRWNNIGDKGAKELAAAFKDHETLEYLNLKGKKYSDETWQFLRKTQPENKTLQI